MDAADIRVAEVASRERHAMRMASLRHEREAVQSESASLRALLTDVQRTAAADVRALSSKFRAMPPHAATGSAASAAAAADADERRVATLAAKRGLTEELERQAFEMEALVAHEVGRTALAERTAAAAASRRQRLASVSRLHRWDESTRSLCACELVLVADGRCLQTTDSDPTRVHPPLLVPTSRLLRPVLTARTRAFAECRSATPAHSWLYVTVRWWAPAEAPHDRGAGAWGVAARVPTVAAPPATARRRAHFCCATRSEAAGLLLALSELVRAREEADDAAREGRQAKQKNHEQREARALAAASRGRSRGAAPTTAMDAEVGTSAAAEAVAGTAAAETSSLGSVLWQQVGLRLHEEARDAGKRPQQVLAEVVRMAAADRKDAMRRAGRAILRSGLAAENIAPGTAREGS